MGIAGQTARDLDRPLGEDGDAVEGLLPVGGDVVAEVLDLGARKRFVEALDFLQAQRVRALLLEIVEEMRQALADRIDVPGGDDQRRLPCAERRQSRTVRPPAEIGRLNPNGDAPTSIVRAPRG